MNISGEIVIRAESVDELARVAVALATVSGPKPGEETDFERDRRIASTLYGVTAAMPPDTGVATAEAHAAFVARDQAIRDRDFWRTQAEKFARRVKRAEGKVRIRSKRKAGKRR